MSDATREKEVILRVSEVYESIQGEGPRVGTPTVFLRFGGCNLRCPLWPCDTQHAIDPQYRDEWKKLTAEKVIEQVNTFDAENICLTGGEPFLQNKEALRELTELLKLSGRTVECFSNGQLEYPHWAPAKINFVLDFKLPGSGEYKPHSSVTLNNLRHMQYAGLLGRQQSVKFTIADVNDYDTAVEFYDTVMTKHPNIDIYAGVVWGKLDNAVLVKWMLRDSLPWKFTMQVHNHIWDRSQRGI